MILFVSKYPNLENDPSGWLQRVAAIDAFFKDKNRIYLDISFRKNLIPKIVYKEEKLEVYKLNFFLHFIIVLYFALKAKFVYVHTSNNSLKTLPVYFIKKVITDMHGIPPEEFKICYKNDKASRFYGFLESFIIKKSYKIIAVTNAMKNHYYTKYKNIKAEILVIPIFDNSETSPHAQHKEGELYNIIYSGGVENWQNVDFMLEAISKIKDKFKFVILTGCEKEFKELLKQYELEEYINPIKVPKSEVYNYYRDADFGFIPREDNIVNRVACPTKLIEYIMSGVIPLVLQPEIGDFNEFKYSYLTVENLLAGNIPSDDEINEMRNNNYTVIENMRKITTEGIKKLLSECN